MPSFHVFIDKQLLKAEHQELVNKGYFKLRVELSEEHLREFESKYKMGDEITFHAPDGQDVRTFISSIDVGLPHGNIYKVFIGFTLV